MNLTNLSWTICKLFAPRCR